MAIPGNNFSALVSFKLKQGKDYDKDVVPVMQRFVETTSKEADMFFYGFARSTSDPSVFVCREHYKNADAFLVHLANVGKHLEEMGEFADITMVTFVGSEEDTKNAKLIEATKALPTTFITL
ncbi:hypothetical protein PTSG_10464 [Salpingoeca rosetta]|uniref:ABM domain-containing protein n=1 Tax=Salpingoeca rosetta (strain ATCC 50818 / BSB-021) TaxID=946362 RepID=F2UPR2_SALR5|nr:uncharacterized protein PTSG_10464 [Salpingoeca rosetta]EGD79617.1 hypothetical protein PTSG_10464 [Salpingoeca rosetta]|eukprot:XP_004988845.1 hypothetical protein PTSG_10464 [Salpingoeca rosetta]